jgi:hypothetical protein
MKTIIITAIALVAYCINSPFFWGKPRLKETEYAQNNRVFKRYLDEKFGLTKIKTPKTHYYIMFGDGCFGCKKWVSSFLQDSIAERNKDQFTLITQHPENLPKNLKAKVLVDSDNHCGHLNISCKDYGVTILKVKNGEVDSVRGFELSSIETIPDFIDYFK